ncbi:synaptobrevin [Nitzschia inconspicua]|uniref:Synaptobrevin n=1 Tax=Nitzschia inconspicua TaxID=303405 RepID=A0A9K3KGY3_9STRA|nr:synaptobrevin [Nitzschia inconspicua]
MKNRLFFSSNKRKEAQQQQEAASSIAYPYHDTLSRDLAGKTPSILWSAILRNDTMLVEADLGAALHTEVQEAASLLLKKPPTPGWEHATLAKYKVSAAASGHQGLASLDDDPNGKLKGMKFHVYENFAEEEDPVVDGEGSGDEWVNYEPPSRPVQRRYKNDGLTIWTFACVYDPSLVDFIQVQSFLEKIVTVTEIYRQPTVRVEGESRYDQWHDPQQQQQDSDPFSDLSQPSSSQQRSPQDVWRYGSHHAAQSTFAPILLQRMEEVSYYGKLAMCHAKVESVKEIMSRNIDLILENDERLAVMATEKAAQLNEMAKVFAKNSKKVKRQMLWNNAKHGAIIGTAITAGVAVVAVPPLLALL